VVFFFLQSCLKVSIYAFFSPLSRFVNKENVITRRGRSVQKDDASKSRPQRSRKRKLDDGDEEEGSPEFSLEGIRSKKRRLNRDAVGPLCSTASFSRFSVSSSSSSSVAGMTPIAIRSGIQLPVTVDF